ncbi:MAG: alkaline shock response membrane anchor protein AmaP [Halanaerobiales bacterium]
MKVFNRLILVIITLSFMFVSLLITIYSFGLVGSSSLPILLEGLYKRFEVGLLFLAAFILGAWVIYPFFTQKIKEKITVVNNTELGEVDVTLEALENLVRSVANQQEEIEDIDTKLEPTENGIRISLTGKVYPSTVIPELTENLQKVIKGYIEDTTGVQVEEVRILIDNIYNNKEKDNPKKHNQVKEEEEEK